jgi:hypothetical protein
MRELKRGTLRRNAERKVSRSPDGKRDANDERADGAFPSVVYPPGGCSHLNHRVGDHLNDCSEC